MEKRILSLLLSLAMIFTVLVTEQGVSLVWASTGDFSGGDGTQGNPYIITSAEQLDKARNYLDKYFKLGSDIALTAYLVPGGAGYEKWGANGWEPIGTDSQGTGHFTGSFDGSGYKITGLWLNRTEQYAGLFGYTENAVFQNLNIEIANSNVTAASTDAYAGGLAGYQYKGSVKNCNVTGNVTADGNGAYAGGLVGYQNGVITEKSHTVGSVSATGSNAYAGGLVGYQNGGGIENCYAIGSVSGENSGGLTGYQSGNIKSSHTISSVSGKNAGGLVGYQKAGSTESCYATGNVMLAGSGANTGGLVGYQDGGSIGSCYAAGNVSGENAGGLVGCQKAGSIENCYATGRVTAAGNSTCSGGLVGYQNGGSIGSCYATGNVNGENAGGLVGSQNAGSIKSCYAVGGVDGENTGGLVGPQSNGTIADSYFNIDTTGQADGVSNKATDVVGLTTLDMINNDVLATVMSGLGNEFTKRSTEDRYCYYPELTVFKDKISEPQTSVAAGITVVRQDVNVSGFSAELTYGQDLGQAVISGKAKEMTPDGADIEGEFKWEDETIKPGVSNGGYKASFTPDSELYKKMYFYVPVTVKPKDINIIPKLGQSKVYGTHDSVFTYDLDVLTPLEAGDRLYGMLGREQGEVVGEYNYTLGSLSAGLNYKLELYTDSGYTFEIVKADPIVELELIPDEDPDSNYVTLKATLIKSGSGNYPTGEVIFWDNGTELGREILNGQGECSLLIEFTSTGNYSMTAEYTGDDNYNDNVSSLLNYDVTKLKQAKPSFTNIPAGNEITYGDNNNEFLAGATGGDSTGGYIYRSSDDNILEIDAFGKVIVKKAGTATLYLKKEGDIDYNDSNEASVTITVKPKTITITGVEVNDKIYDGEESAEIVLNTAGITGVYGTDDLDFIPGTAVFEDKNAGEDKTVTFSGFTLAGNSAENYVLLEQPDDVTANIIARPVYYGAIYIENKTYDGNVNASLTGGEAMNIISGDDVILNVASEFDDKNAGIDKNVNIYFSLTGEDSFNYSAPGDIIYTADILPMEITVVPESGQTKAYGTEDPEFTYTVLEVLPEADIFTGVLDRIPGEHVGEYAYTIGSLSAGGNYNLSLDSTDFFEIVKAEPTVELEIEPESGAVYGDTVTLKATVTKTGNGGDVTGTVIFWDGTVELGRKDLDEHGECSIEVNLSAGNHKIIAEYSGDSNYSPGTDEISGYYVEGLTQTGFIFQTSAPGNMVNSPSFSYTNKASGGEGTGAVAYAITGGTGSASINVNTGEITKVTVTGTLIVTATKAADSIYNSVTATYTLTVVEPTVTDISITAKPSKLVYTEGESFNPAGMVVTASYNNGTTAVVPSGSYTYSGYSSTVGTKTITVSYSGKTASFTVTVNAKVPSSITSGTYTVSGGYIRKISPGTTVTKLLNGINEKNYIKVYNGNTQVTGNTVLATGMVVKLLDGSTVKQSVTVVVTGDLNGDGAANALDLLVLKRHILEIKTLSGAYKLAADVNGDGQANALDLLVIKRYILGIGSL